VSTETSPARTRVRVAFLSVVVLAAIAVLIPSLADLPVFVRSSDPELWLIAALALIVDARPLNAPGRAPIATIFPSVTFTFALLLGWGLTPRCSCRSSPLSSPRSGCGSRPGGRSSTRAGTRSRSPPRTSCCGRGRHPARRGRTVGRHRHARVVAILISGCVWFAVSDGLVTTAVWLRFGGRWVSVLTGPLRQEALSNLSLLALGPMVVAAGNVSTALVPLILVPLYTVHELARLHHRGAAQGLQDDLTGLPNRKALFAEMRGQVRAYAQRSARLRRQRVDGGARPPADGAAAARHRPVPAGQRRARAYRRGPAAGGGGAAAAGGDRGRRLRGPPRWGRVRRARPPAGRPDAAGVLAERVADALAEPVTLDGLAARRDRGDRVAVHPDHGTGQHHPAAPRRGGDVRRQGRAARYAIYSPESDQNSVERLELLADLRRALDGGNDELRLFYQPQIDMATGEVVGTEALLALEPSAARLRQSRTW
jgi:hypothetical protein